MKIKAADLKARGSRYEMETFAEKVRYGNGPRFDPLMEEKGLRLLVELGGMSHGAH